MSSSRTQGLDGGPLDVWGNDQDAHLASWENLCRGGHGIWYQEEGVIDEAVELLEEDEHGQD